MTLLKSITQKLNAHFNELTSKHNEPQAVALGFSVGTFISILPTPGISFIIIAALIVIFPTINKASAFSAAIIFNPIVISPLYVLAYKIGDLLFHDQPKVNLSVEFLDNLVTFTRRFLVGNFLIAITIALLSYFIIRFLLFKNHKK